MKKLKLIGSIGLMLFIGGGVYATHASAMERHAVYFDRNYGGKTMVPDEKNMAKSEFTNTIDPYSKFQIVDASQSKQDVINALESTFANSKEEDINYLVFHSHGWSGGIIDFTFSELRSILDQYKGHFVLVLSACNSGGMINKIENSFKKAFLEPRSKMGEFKDSKYNVFCACTKDQPAYNNGKYGWFIKAYFDASKIGKNDFLNADYNHDGMITASELSQYLEKNGKAGCATPVSQIVEPDLPLFVRSRFMFNFYGIGTSSGQDTHIAQLRYNNNQTVTIQTYSCKPHPYFKNIYVSIRAVDASGDSIFTKDFRGTDQVKSEVETFNFPEGSYLMIYHAEGNSKCFTSSYDQELKQHPGTTYYYVVHNNKLIQTDKIPVQKNSIRLNLKGTDSYLYVENRNLYGNNFAVGNSMTITKNGKTVSQASDNKFTDTELKAGDTFTIQPINNSTWQDIPVTNRSSLGTFDSSAKYTFKVNNDGSISHVATEKNPAQNKSVCLNLKGTGSYVFVENGNLYGNTATVGSSMTITKNGKTVSQASDNKFTDTELKAGDTFTIQPINNSTWQDIPVTDRNSLGTFDSSAKYTFKVNNDGSISHVATEKNPAQNKSVCLNLKGTGSYVFVENGNLYGNTATVGSSMTITKNGKTVSQASDNKFTDTELKAGDTFTIQPINNSTWQDIPVTNRSSLGTFDSSAKYTFKVNNDGSISHVATEKNPAQNKSVCLNLKGTGSYVFVENGNLYGNTATVGSSMTITKNGKTVSQDSNGKFTELKAGDTFTIQPINNSTWQDVPVTNRNSLGTFDSSAKYTFKVNNDGSISLVATEENPAQNNSIHLNKSNGLSEVYRLYNPNSGEHFYTQNFYEKNNLQNVGWRYEGIGWMTASSGQPVYRVYNPNARGGDHYYTLSKWEAQQLVNKGWHWDNNGAPAFYSNGSKNLYVAYNPNAVSGSHNYTTSSYEQNHLLKIGWIYGAIAWKVN
ncbi:putative mucin/carbohydrate-binding domain-containing protein [Lactococcus lactis]